MLVYGSNDCGEIINDERGIISSPGYPANYGSNLDCVWIVTPPNGKDINLSFTDVDVSNKLFSHC